MKILLLFLIPLGFILQFNSVVSEKQLPYGDVSNNIEDVRQRHADYTYAGMQPSKTKCYDFTEYASGNIKVDSFQYISFDNEEQVYISLHNILSAMDLNELSNISERKAKIFYDSCINSQHLDDLPSNNSDILKIISAWPILVSSPEENNDNFDIYGLTILADIHTEFSIIERKIVLDTKYNNIYRIRIEQPDTEHMILHSIILEVILDPLINYLEASPQNNLKETVQEVIDFSKEIIQISTDPSQSNIKRINKKSLKQKIPDIDWNTYFSKLSSEPIPETELIMVKNWSYFKNLGVLLKKTSKRIVGYYLLFYIALDLDSLESFDFRNSFTSGEDARMKNCLDILNSSMSSVLNRLYLKHNFNSGIQSQASSIIENLKKSLKKTFQDAEWLDYPSRLFANEKLNNISIIIGTDTNIIYDDNEYDKLNIEANELFTNLWKMKHFEYEREQLKVGQESSNTPIFNSINPNIVNYNNKLLFVPASILQPPYFHIHFPAWANYAGFGSLFGYHLADVFNYNKIEYNSESRLNDWWNMKVLMHNLEQKHCYMSQYSLHVTEQYPSLKPLLYNTIISADSSLKIAIEAYECWLDENDDLDGTLEPRVTTSFGKLFFIYYAQIYASRLIASRNRDFISIDLYTQTTRNSKKYEKYTCSNNIRRCHYW